MQTPFFSSEDAIKAENEYLKMKLMLEHGAVFGFGEMGHKMTPEMENSFLKSIEAVENNFMNNEMITVYEKIDSPTHFKPVAEIPEDKFDEVWEELLDYMNLRGINLGACSPRVTSKELYRYTIEEMFQYPIEKYEVPGAVCEFIYDLAHPDPIYNNTETAVHECMMPILSKKPFNHDFAFLHTGLKLNDHTNITLETFGKLINNFKQAYDAICLEVDDMSDCVIEKNECKVSGKYEGWVELEAEKIPLQGKWAVGLYENEDTGNWYIGDVWVEGITF